MHPVQEFEVCHQSVSEKADMNEQPKRRVSLVIKLTIWLIIAVYLLFFVVDCSQASEPVFNDHYIYVSGGGAEVASFDETMKFLSHFDAALIP